MPSAPNLDTTFGVLSLNKSGFPGASTITTGVISTVGAAGSNELMVLCINYEANGNPSSWLPVILNLTSVTCSIGSLTFSKLGFIQNPNNGSYAETVEVWAAPCSSQFNPEGSSNFTYTLNWNGNIDEVSVVAFMVQGLNSISAPLDTSGTNPASAYNSSNTTPPSLSLTTSQADDLLIGIMGSAENTPSGTPAGWTNVGSGNENGGAQNEGISVDYKTISSAGSQTYANTNGTSEASYTGMLLAFTANAGGGVTGTFAPTETDDTFSGAGYVPATATFAPTENVDTFASVGYTSLTAALAVTETPDTFAGVGYGPPARSGRRRVFIIS